MDKTLRGDGAIDRIVPACACTRRPRRNVALLNAVGPLLDAADHASIRSIVFRVCILHDYNGSQRNFIEPMFSRILKTYSFSR